MTNEEYAKMLAAMKRNVDAHPDNADAWRHLAFSMVSCVFLSFCSYATASISVGPQPEGAYSDTEVSTNIVFNLHRNDVKAFDVRMELAGSVSNCVLVAFGRDADGNGDLAPEETDFVLGWRLGKYFIENVADDERLFANASAEADSSRFLQLSVKTDGAFKPKTAAFTNEVGACFADLGVQEWLFRPEWNLAKVTRRGVDPASEWLTIDNRYSSFVIRLR